MIGKRSLLIATLLASAAAPGAGLAQNQTCPRPDCPNPGQACARNSCGRRGAGMRGAAAGMRRGPARGQCAAAVAAKAAPPAQEKK